jgi:hypothetical protein
MRRYRYHLSYDDMNHDVMNVAIVRRHINTSVWWLKIVPWNWKLCLHILLKLRSSSILTMEGTIIRVTLVSNYQTVWRYIQQDISEGDDVENYWP